MIRIGVTGGIGSGKSTVSALFCSLFDAVLIDADAISRTLTAPQGIALARLRNIFGESVFYADGTLNRTTLRSLVFDSPDARAALANLLHPLIRCEIERNVADARAAQRAAAVIDIPLLVEDTYWRSTLDRVVVVDCPISTQMHRVILRSGLLADQVEKIIASQSTREEKIVASDAVIANGDASSLRDLDRAVLQIGTIWHLAKRIL